MLLWIGLLPRRVATHNNLHPSTTITSCSCAQPYPGGSVQSIYKGFLGGPALPSLRLRLPAVEGTAVEIGSSGEIGSVDAGNAQEFLFDSTQCRTSELGNFTSQLLYAIGPPGVHFLHGSVHCPFGTSSMEKIGVSGKKMSKQIPIPLYRFSDLGLFKRVCYHCG
jgi:hypothetical protein